MIGRVIRTGNVTVATWPRRRALTQDQAHMRVFAALLVFAMAAGIVNLVRARRRRAAVPELNQHPERLEQMLDESDDA